MARVCMFACYVVEEYPETHTRSHILCGIFLTTDELLRSLLGSQSLAIPWCYSGHLSGNLVFSRPKIKLEKRLNSSTDRCNKCLPHLCVGLEVAKSCISGISQLDEASFLEPYSDPLCTVNSPAGVSKHGSIRYGNITPHRLLSK